MKKISFCFAILAIIFITTSCDPNSPSHNRFANTTWIQDYHIIAGHFELTFTSNEFELLQVYDFDSRSDTVAKGTYIPDGYGKSDYEYCEGYRAKLSYSFTDGSYGMLNYFPTYAFINGDTLYLAEKTYVYEFTKK